MILTALKSYAAKNVKSGGKTVGKTTGKAENKSFARKDNKAGHKKFKKR